MVEMAACPQFTVKVRKYPRKRKMQVTAYEMQSSQLQMWEMLFH